MPVSYGSFQSNFGHLFVSSPNDAVAVATIVTFGRDVSPGKSRKVGETTSSVGDAIHPFSPSPLFPANATHVGRTLWINCTWRKVESFQRAQRKRDRRARAAAAVSAESSSSSVTAAGASSSGSSSGGGGKVGPAIKKLAPAAATTVDQDTLMSEEQQQQQQQHEHHHHQQHHQHHKQQHQQQQWLRRQRRQATVVTEAATLRGSGMRGGSGGINGEDGVGERGRERAPISAVRSAQVRDTPCKTPAIFRFHIFLVPGRGGELYLH